MNAATRKIYKAECLTKLRKLCPRGTRVYTAHEVSRSGVRHWIRCFVAPKKGEIQQITGLIAEVCGGQFANRGDRYGIVRNGCGFDSAHEVVYDLAWTLYGQDGRRELIQERLI